MNIKEMTELSDGTGRDVISDYVNKYGLTDFWHKYQQATKNSTSAEEFISKLAEAIKED